ncbi:MAG TPA: PTS sugar transporter subunit IIA [Kiritimatiellae bacterium]|nr:PTS sugar transporter subunit IIA [Kiritimatiellia bacterium]
MNNPYRKILQPRNIILDLRATDKPGVIAELVDHLVSTGDILPGKRDEVLEAVLNREKRMSTGLQHGVAVPHGKTDAVSDLTAALGRSRQGVDFACMDGRPARIFVLILSPQTMAGPHVEFLAEISRLLTRAEVREGLLAAESAEEILRLFDQAAVR